MTKATKEHLTDALKTDYFKHVIDHLQPDPEAKEKQPTAVEKALSVLKKPFAEMDTDPDVSPFEKEVFYAWHKYRVLELENIKSIVPKCETYTIVSEMGHVGIIRKPSPDVLGRVIGKMYGVNKDVNYNEIGGIILSECRVYLEKAVENDKYELLSMKVACMGAVEMVQSDFKKN